MNPIDPNAPATDADMQTLLDGWEPPDSHFYEGNDGNWPQGYDPPEINGHPSPDVVPDVNYDSYLI